MSEKKTQLEILAEGFRNENLIKNTYKPNDQYSSSHKNAISDGDEKGKDAIGSSTDIRTRTEILAKNTYNPNDQYSSSHKNAISDGDDKGKDELGSITDINTRNSITVKNTYGPTKTYPDF